MQLSIMELDMPETRYLELCDRFEVYRLRKWLSGVAPRQKILSPGPYLSKGVQNNVKMTTAGLEPAIS